MSILEPRDAFVERIAMLAHSMNGRELQFSAEIGPNTNIVLGLRLDAISAADFIVAIEGIFGTTMPINDIVEVRTVGELAELLWFLKMEAELGNPDASESGPFP